MVVDNASTDGTKALVKAFQTSHSNLLYHYEEKIGLSHARNCGWQKAQTPWVGYLDDDAKVPTDYIEQALKMIKETNYDCFGGTYYAWFKYGKPRWLPDGFGNKPILRANRGEVPEGKFLSGGVFFVTHAAIEKVGGFNPSLGMTDDIGYGEENDVQEKLRNEGYKIGYDPELYIEHCVMPHKFKLRWHLRRAYYTGKASQQLESSHSTSFLVYWFLRTFLSALFFRGPLGLFKILLMKGYYWQSWVLEISSMPLSYLGGLSSKIYREMKINK